jgi:hypothetical protein
MGQFSLLEKDKANRSVVTAWLIAENKNDDDRPTHCLWLIASLV